VNISIDVVSTGWPKKIVWFHGYLCGYKMAEVGASRL